MSKTKTKNERKVLRRQIPGGILKHHFTRDERRVDQTKVPERREGSQLPQQLVGGVRVAVQDKLLQGASKEELQGAWAKEPFA